MLLAAGLLGFLASRSVDTAFAAPCATPGADGPGGTLTGTVNTYHPGTANAAAGATSISVGASRGAATAIAAGDLLLVIQMQDAAINSADIDSYGDGVAGGTASGSTNVNNSGEFEYVRATGAVAAGVVGISGAGAGSGLVNSYVNAAATATQGQRRFQVVRVPQYSIATLGSGLTAAAWNGATGGILAVDVTGTLALGGATVDVTGLGFRGGGARQLTGAGGGSNTAYRSLATAAYHAQKGEGIAGTPRYVRNGAAAATDTGVEGYPNGSSARGAPGNAGGGGTDGNPATNDQNSGGGGGANGGTGGQGGNTWSSNLARGGHGGTAFAGSVSQLVLGGGGGAGTRNNSPGIPAASAGGNGGGMVMLRAGNLSGTGTITADGQSGVVPENDAGGGGGAGGSVMVLSAGGGTAGLTVNARGAVGGDGEQATSGSHGPGGGGGGGVVVLSGAAGAVNVGGGAAGDTNNGSGTFIAYGATAGTAGSSTTSATLPGVPGTSAGTECTPQVTVTKTTSTPVVVDSGSGGAATYTITVANAAGRAAATNTSISDALPAGFTFASTTLVTLTGGATRPSSTNPSVGSSTPAWGTFTIPGGGQVQITFTTAVAAGTTPATYQNPATATYTDPARATAGGTTSASYNPASSTGEDVQVRLPIADVGITKTVSNATPALNTNVTFTVTVTNGGPELARAVSVADALPAGLTFVSATPSVGAYNSGTGVWTVGNLTNGASATLSLVATVTTHTLLTNTATASTTSTDPVAGNNSASATVNVPDANLAVTKSVSNATPAINTNVTFTVTVTNGGPDTASAASVADLLPAGLTFVSATPSVGAYNSGTGVWAVGNLANGASATLSLVATVTTHTLLTNTATVSATTYDPTPANNAASASVNVPDANLAVTKTVSNATPAVGSNVTFTVTVTNGGPDTASAVSVADLLPAGLTFVSATPSVGAYNSGTGVWAVGNLANGASATLSLVATVTTHTSITNTATAFSSTYDPVSGNDSASASVNAPDANLAVTKSVSNATPGIGTNVTFTVTLSNGGPDSATAASVADLLPAGLTFVSATPSVGAYNSGTGVWSVGNLANGASATLSLVATVTTHTLLTNTATASSSTYDPVSGNNSASATVNVPDANLAVTKSVSNATPGIGTNVTFTVTVTNNGPDAATAASVADLLPAGLTFVSATPSVGSYNSGTGVWAVGNLASGASATLSLVATVTTHTLLTNTASVSSSTYDPTAANNAASATVNVPDADLAVTKSVSNATPAINTNVTFTVTVTNGGPDTASAASVADLLPAGLTFVSATPSAGLYNSGTGVWTVGNLNNGASATLSLVATVTTPTLLTNTATVSATTYDPNPANNAASATVNVPDANLAVTKSVSNATPAINTNVTFTVTVTNGGPDTASAASVADLLPAGLTFVSATPSVGAYNSGTGVWAVGNLATGASATLSLVATVTTHTLLTNTATVSATTYDPTPANNAASASVNVPDANLAVTKTVNDPTPAMNGNVTFTVTITNNGPDTAQSASVADALPAGLTFASATPSVGTYNSGTGVWTVGNVANGASATLSLVATVTTHTAITNTATASSSTYDPAAANDSASAAVDVPDANLAVTKSVSNATPAINTNVTFTVTITNNGPDTAQSASVADALPAGLAFVSAIPSAGSYAGGIWTVGNLANGASATLSLVATVTTHTLLTNTATVSATTYDPTPANNAASASVNVPDANLAVTKTVNDPTPAMNGNVTFTVTITNNGPDTAQSASVADALPAGLTFASATPSVGTYNSGTGVWTVGNVANGASATLSLVATVTTHTAITNTATASSSTYDPAAANDSASAAVDVPDANLAVAKTVNDPTPEIGANVTFTVTVTNGGPDLASGVTVADALPAGLTLVSSSPSTGSYNSGTGTWTVGNLANGASATLGIVATVTAPAAITNTATASSSTFDPVGGNNAASASVNARQANLAVTKTVSDATPAINTNVTFTVTVTNNGPEAASGVAVADALPGGLSLVSATPATGSYAGGVWTIGNLANGTSTALTIVATVTTHTAVTNAATVSATTYDPIAGNNSASAAVDVPDANLAVTKAVNDASPAINDVVTFTVTVTNGGPDSAQGVSVADALPAGLSLVSANPSVGSYAAGVWSVGNLANGASATLQILAQVNTHLGVTNTATGSSSTYDPVSGNNAGSATVNVPDADLAVTKTVDNPTPAINTDVTFTVTLTNNGPNASAGVAVTDALPSGLSLVSATPSAGTFSLGVWNVGTVANGASATLVVVATVTGHTQITNTATAGATTFDPVSANNAASASVNVPDANLAVTKTVNNATPAINTNVTFTVTVTNTGPDAAQGVSVADLLPAGLAFVSATPSSGSYASGPGVWTVGNLANGSSATLSIVATVTTHTAVMNTATASSATFDPTSGDDSASSTVNVPDADLAVTKIVDIANPDVGGNVTFTVNVANAAGPDTAQAVTVTDVLPAGLALVSSMPSTGSYNNGTGIWTVGDLGTGGGATLTIVATATSHTAVTNTATASSSTFDPTPADDSGSAVVDAKDANLAVTKVVDDPTPAVGGNVTFTVTVSNAGPDTAQAVSVADALPAGLTFVSASTATGSYSSATGNWTVGALGSGASGTLTLVATVAVPTLQTNTATTGSTTFDPNLADNTDSASVDARDADLSIAKSVNDPTPSFGGQVTFLVTVTNNGPDTATGVGVADALPAGLNLVSATPSQGSYAAGTWTVGSISSGANATLAIVAAVTTHTAVTNTATVSTSTHDPVGVNDAASVGVNALDADLAITKVVSDTSPEVGDPVTFTLGVVNNGPDLAQGVAVADILPSGLAFVSSSTSTGSYDSGTGVWAIGDLANGANATLDIVATVSSSGQLMNSATVSASTFDPAPADNTDDVTLNARQADLAVTKTVSDATPAFGTDVAFTVTITNNGPDAASGVSVADALPPGLTFVSATPSVGTYGGGTWTIGSLANGASATLTVNATVTTHLAVTNTAAVTATTDDATSANNADAATVDVPDANLVVSKVVSDATPEVGSNVTFTVTVANAGPDTAAAVTVSDPLPLGLTLVSAVPSVGSYAAGVWSVGNLANGASETLTIVVTPTTHLPVTNTASASATTYDPVSGNNSSSAGIDARNADVALTKSVNNPTPALGTDVTFTVTVTNAGPDASQGVSVTDVLPAGLTLVSATPSTGPFATGTGTWTVGTLANGATATLDIVATVVDHTSITNTATLTTGTFDPTPGDHSGSATVDALDSDLSIVKSVDTTTPQVGDNVTFTLDVTNNGPDDATGVSVTDVLPGGLTFVSASGGSYNAGTGLWSLGALPNGATATLTVIAQVTSAATITNTATVTGPLPDPNPADNTSSVAVDPQQADLVVTKTVDDAAPAVGANVTFTVTVTNTGPDAAQSTSVADALPPGLTLVGATASTGNYASGVWDVGQLAAGDSQTLQIDATVTIPTAVTNTATASTPTFDPDASDNNASATVDARDADLSVSKNVDDPTPNVGGTVTFLVSVSNNGPDASAGVSVADPLPAGITLLTATPSVGSYSPATGIWTIGSLGDGAIATLAVVARVNIHTPLTNSATASAATTDPVPGNDAASVDVDAQDADLVLTKSVDDAAPEVGANVTFTVAVANNGPDAAQAVSVADALPAGLGFVSATVSNGSYDSGTGVWTVGILGNGATATLDIVATATGHTTVTNTADVTSTTFDPTTGDHGDTAVVDARDADLTISKFVDDATPQVGSDVVFTVSVTNNGPDAAAGVVVQDQLPAELTFVSASSGTYNSTTGSWPVGNLANGATATLMITATVTDHLPVTNAAAVAATTFDPATADNSASVVVNALDADLAVTKTVDDATPALGDNVTFTIAVHNNGPDAATGVAVSDPLPTGLTFVSSGTASGSYSDTTGQWTIGALANAATATLTITARVDDPAAITNTATVSSPTHDPAVANDTDAATVDVAEADLEVTKSVDNAAPAINGTVRFTVTVTNHGPDAAAQVTVADALPAGLTLLASTPSTGTYSGGTWTVGTLANGATATLVVDARVTVHTPVVNLATAASSTHDPVAANNSATSTVDVPNADLTISKLVDVATPNLNDDVTFTISVANNGPDAAAGVSVADTLPTGLTLVSATPSAGAYTGGVWSIGAIANGASETLVIVASVDVPTAITNTAAVSASTFDPVAAGDTSSVTVNVPDADLEVTKTVDDASPSVGANVTFTVGAVNHGPDAATATVVTDALPAGLAFVSANPSTGTYDSGTGVWSIGTLANGAAASLDIVAQVTTTGGVINTATVSAAEHDAIPANNTASASVAGVQADLAVTKTVSDPTPSLGGNVTFAVTVTNNGPDPAAAVRVDDLLPPGLMFVSAAPSVGTYNQATGVWAVGSVGPGVTRTLDIVATVSVTTPVLNVATASSTTFDQTPANNAASAAVDVQNADIGITKTVDTTTPSMNGTVTYLVTATNNGPDGAAGVSVADPLPSGLTLVSATPSVGAYSGATGTWTIGAMTNGATATLTIVAQVTVQTPVNNVASVTSTTFDAVAANDSDSVAVDVPDADLTIAKTVDDTTPALGSNVTFTVTVVNAGPDAAAGVSVADALPAGLAYVSSSASTGGYSNGTGAWTIGSLANGATATLDIVATVTAANAITNTATVSSSTHDPAGPNSASATVDVPQADLAVSKVVDDPTPALGANVTFTVVVTNNGPDQSTGVAVADALPVGLNLVSATPSTGTYAGGVWTVGTLASGVSDTLQIVAQVVTGAPVTNTATASATTFDPNLANNADSAGVDVADADLAVTKTVDDTTPNLGGTVHFTIAVTNNGPDAASGVSVADPLPAGLTFLAATPSTGSYAAGVWTVGNLADGATETLDLAATVTGSATITNSATVTSAAFDGNPANDDDSVTVDAPDADLSIVKSVDDPAPSLNGTVTFLVTVTNNGPDTAPAVSVADTLPAGLAQLSATPSVGNFSGGTWTVGPLANGATETLSVVARVTSSALITNTAAVTSGAADPNPADDTSSASVDVPEADVAVSKTVDDPTPALNSDVTFTVTVTNNGPNPAFGVSVADALPSGLTLVSAVPSAGTYTAGVWNVGGLASGATETLDVTASVTSATAITNTATVSSGSFDGTAGNDTDSATVDVPEADLAIQKTVSDPTPAMNGTVTFTLTVTNNGPSLAQAVQVTDVLPAGLSFVSASSPAYVADTWSVGDLPNGSSATLDVLAQVVDPAVLTNTATVSSATLDPVAGNEADSAQVDVPEADLRLTKTVDDATPNEGQSVTYTLSLVNNGPNAASTVAVTDLLPAGLTFVSATPQAGTFSAGVWDLSSIPSGATRQLQIVARVDTQGIVTNNAEVTASGTFDPTSTPGDGVGDDVATVEIDALPPEADLSLTKSVSNAAPPVGGSVTYTLSVRTDGPSATDNVSVIDLLPVGVTYVSSTATQGTYDAGGGTWTVGTMASGATETLTIVVTVDQAGTIVNSAEIGTSDETDPDSTPANAVPGEDDQASVQLVAQGALPQSADLEIVKSASSPVANLGDTISYAIIVTNRGPASATNVQVLEQLPPPLQFVSARTSVGGYDLGTGVWSIPAIANGASASLIVTTHVIGSGAITNTVQILASDQPDPDGPFNPVPGAPGGEQSSATVSVTPPAPASTRLRITKTGPKLVKAGGTVTFTTVVRNTGTVPATAVQMIDCIPTGLSLRGKLTNGKLLKGRLTWRFGTLQPGQSRTIRVRFRVDRDTRGIRGCAAVSWGSNATPVRATARVRVVAGTSRPTHTPVAG